MADPGETAAPTQIMRIHNPPLVAITALGLILLAVHPAVVGTALAQGAADKPADEKKPEKPAAPAADKPAADKPADKPASPSDAPLLPPVDAKAPPPSTPPTPAVAGDASAAPDDAGAAGAAADPAAKPVAEEPKPAPKKGDGSESDTNVFAEDWWATARPVFEIHGYYRVRAEFLSHFALGRRDTPSNSIWPQPADNDYVDSSGVRNRVILCGDDPTNPEPCVNNVQAGANMRFRLNPELHISDNLRVMAQVDLLDNIVLGSTPEGYINQPGDSGGYSVRQRGGYTPIGAFAGTQWAPSAGQNSITDSIVVKRVWGEYMTPIGLLRFGRMASHWGMGMFVNAGDGFDSDYGSTADRIMFVTGIKSWDLYFGGLWDFANEGATSGLITERGGQPYDLIQGDDVDQWGLIIVRRRNPELAKLDLAQGDPVVNGGVYAVYRQQTLDGTATLGATPRQLTTTLVERGAQAVIPDFWFQFMFDKFRFEAEAAMVWGGIENTDIRGGNNFTNPNDPSGEEDGWNIRQFGFAIQSEFKAIQDKLRIQLGFGYATGDQDVEGLSPPAEGFDAQLTQNRTFSTFRFHPDYRVDLILWRQILQRVQAAYYTRPSVEYDFIRDTNGQKIGGGAAIIWSRASQFVQTPGNAHDLGLELNFKLYYQAKDGTLNDDADKTGGFYTQLEYGVMFPLGGLGYLPGQEATFEDLGTPYESSTAQTLRWYLGILF